MSIIKTAQGTYRVRAKYPKNVQLKLGLNSPYFDKIFKTRKEAKNAELDFKIKVKQLQDGSPVSIFEQGGGMLFKDFYETFFIDAYASGLTSNSKKLPSDVTVHATKTLFKHHLLPLFGAYTLNELNNNKIMVSQKMTAKAQEYANIKIIISYLNQLFDLAEEYDYIEHNRLTKILRKIKPIKQIKLEETKSEEEKYLTDSQLQEWFKAVESDYQSGCLSLQDYILFWVTYFLSDRKSESYAFKWKHIDFDNNIIHLEKALNKWGQEKGTKANKETDIVMPERLKKLLTMWQSEQTKALQLLGMAQTSENYLFTYDSYRKPVYPDYLNYRMRRIEKRHPELAHATPHKLRHTSATLAKQYGMSMEEISQGLTHSGTTITKTYVNNRNVIPITPADFAYQKIVGGE